MKRNGIRLLELGLAAVLLVSLAMVLRSQREYQKGASSYDEAAEIVSLPVLVPEPRQVDRSRSGGESDQNLPLLAEVDLSALQARNPDVMGWISIPDTVLSYPIVQGEDNAYYLNHTWQKEGNSVGAVFMDCRSRVDMSAFNTLIYGHRIRNGSMFGSLRHYNDVSYWQAHPSVYMVCAEDVRRYDIFAAYEADVQGRVYDLNYPDAESREDLIASSIALSAIDTGIVPTAEDQVITLSTCTGRGYAKRWVVLAVLAEAVPLENAAE